VALRYSPQETRQFAEALAQVPLLADPDGRNQVIQELETVAGQPLDLARRPTATGDIVGLAEACLSRPELVPLLLSVLTVLEPSSPAVLALAGLTDRLVPPTVLKFTERQELLSFLSVTDETDLSRLYTAAVGPLGPLPTQPVDKKSLLYDLEDTLPEQGSLPPLLLFTELLARELDETTAGALRAWTERVSDRLGLSQELRTARRAFQAPGAPERHYLSVELSPDPISADVFRLRAWLQDSSGRRLVQFSSPDQPIRTSEIARSVQDLIRQAPVTPDLTVEFIIPHTLLDFPFEQVTDDSRDRQEIGARYPVLVRSLERLLDAFIRPRWQRKWTELQRRPEASSVLWLSRPGEFSRRALQPRLQVHDTLCLVQAYQPLGEHEELQEAVFSGIPAIVWNRGGLPSADFAAGARRELFRDGALGLPDQVRRVRMEAVTERSSYHLGRCVALLWDDPNRLPEPELRLRAPDDF